MTLSPRRQDHNRRSVRLGLEALEARDLPSGQPLSVPFDINIVGTGITFDQRGQPSSLGGNIYLGTQPLGPVIGQYQEALTPLLLDGMMVGTMGRATFTFFPGALGQQPLATVTTLDFSFIQGIVPPSGALLVGSNGAISGSTGSIGNPMGGFASSSLLALGPQFASDTQVHFTAISV